jgi:uncharacterized protein (DUF1778 family)
MKSLTDYIVQLIEKDSQRVIKAHGEIVLKDNVFDPFIQACAAANVPNKKLREAKAFAKRNGIR